MARLAVVVKPKQAFLDWLNAADPASHELTCWESATGNQKIYLIAGCDTGAEAQPILARAV